MQSELRLLVPELTTTFLGSTCLGPDLITNNLKIKEQTCGIKFATKFAIKFAGLML